MQEQTKKSVESWDDSSNPQLIEWRIYEDHKEKETQIRKFINGHMTTQISNRYPWSKHGRQGCWQRARSSIEGLSKSVG